MDEARRATVITRRRERGDRVFDLGVLVAKHEQTGGVAIGEHAFERQWGTDVRQRQDAALFGRLDRVRAQALEIDARNLGMARDDGLQTRGAHLHRLLCHVVEARVLEGREQVVQVERAGCTRVRLQR